MLTIALIWLLVACVVAVPVGRLLRRAGERTLPPVPVTPDDDTVPLAADDDVKSPEQSEASTAHVPLPRAG